MSNTYTVMPSPYQTIFSNSGLIVPGGLVWTYLAGTSTPTATYTDVTGSVQNTNPIVADSAGRFVAFLAPSLSYKFVFESAATPPAHGTVLKTVDNVLPVPASGGTANTATSVNNFRLTLLSGVPVPPTDVLAATTLYLTPYTGTQISLYDALGVSTTVTSSQVSIALPATTATNYDAFTYLSSGLPVLELNPWRNSGQAITGATNATPIIITANAHGLSNGDEVYVNSVVGNTAANGTWTVANKATNTFELSGSVGNGAYTAATGWLNARQATGLLSRATVGVLTKSGDLTRLFSGTVRTSASSGQSEDSATKRLLWNYTNRVTARLAKPFAVASYSVPSSTIRQANADTANKVEAVIGVQEATLQLTGTFVASNAGTSAEVQNGFGEDSTTTYTTNGAGGFMQAGAANVTIVGCTAQLAVMPTPGYHTYPLNENAVIVGSNNVVFLAGGAGIFGTLNG